MPTSCTAQSKVSAPYLRQALVEEAKELTTSTKAYRKHVAGTLASAVQELGICCLSLILYCQNCMLSAATICLHHASCCQLTVNNAASLPADVTIRQMHRLGRDTLSELCINSHPLGSGMAIGITNTINILSYRGCTQ